MDIFARFDDLQGHDGSFELVDPVEEMVATDPSDVSQVLQGAESAAADGRWVAGFVAYEAASGLEPGLATRSWPPGHPLVALPLAWFGVFETRREVPRITVEAPGADDVAQWTLLEDEGWHRAAVAQVKDLIAAGDLYQLNLTTRLAGWIGDPGELYRRLAAAQGGAYNALLVTPQHTIVSASPELFFHRCGSRITTKPMKGTAPRGRWAEEDAANGEALARSPKERAENVMIVDLLRNDLGRLAVPGSVHVPELWAPERYPTMWQLTSTIEATARPGVGLVEVFRALFPSGSVTGAPKRRTMQAVAAIEPVPRGVYCGAVGYLSPGGPTPDARFSVAIRTVTVARRAGSGKGGYAEYGVGGGITSPSDPRSEWAEILTKSSVLRRRAAPKGLVETFGVDPAGGPVDLDRHLARLEASAGYFGIPFDVVDAAARLKVLRSTCDAPLRVRLVLDRSGRIEMESEVLRPAGGPVRLGLADRPVDSGDVLLFHKHTDRSMYEGFRRRSPGVDDVVLWNERREVTETTIANLALHLEGRWWTPPLACGLLPGVGRSRLLDDGVLTERVLSLDDLRAATEMAVVSSLRGWRQAILCEPLR